ENSRPAYDATAPTAAARAIWPTTEAAQKRAAAAGSIMMTTTINVPSTFTPDNSVNTSNSLMMTCTSRPNTHSSHYHYDPQLTSSTRMTSIWCYNYPVL